MDKQTAKPTIQTLLADRPVGARGVLPQGSGIGPFSLSIEVIESDGQKIAIIDNPQHDNHQVELTPEQIMSIDWN